MNSDHDARFIRKALILKNLGKLSDRDMYSMNNALSKLLELIQ